MKVIKQVALMVALCSMTAGSIFSAGSGVVARRPFTERENKMIAWIDANPRLYKKLKEGPFGGQIIDPRERRALEIENRRKNKAAIKIQRAFRSQRKHKKAKAKQVQKLPGCMTLDDCAAGRVLARGSSPAESGGTSVTVSPTSPSVSASSPHNEEDYWDKQHEHPGYGHLDVPGYTDADEAYDKEIPSSPIYIEPADFPPGTFTEKEVEQILWIDTHPGVMPSRSDPRVRKAHLRINTAATAHDPTEPSEVK